MKRLLVAIAAVGLLGSAFAFFVASPASAAQTEITIIADGAGVTATAVPNNECNPPDGEGQVDTPSGISFGIEPGDPEELQISDVCTYTLTFSHPSCVLWIGDDNVAPDDDLFASTGATPDVTVGTSQQIAFGDVIYVNVQGDCADNTLHTIYKNVPIADAPMFALTTFNFSITPAADTSLAPGAQPAPSACTGGDAPVGVSIQGDGSPAVTLTAVIADSVLVSNSVLSCLYDIAEAPVDGWTNTMPFGESTVQRNQNPDNCDVDDDVLCGITPFRNVFDPVGISVTKSMDLDDFVVLSNIDTSLLNERIDFFISATEGCQDVPIAAFNNQLGSTGTFANTTPAQVELASFNDNVFAGDDVPVLVDGVPCTYTVEELVDDDLGEYCAPVNGDTQSLTWAPGLTSFDFLFHNDCEAPTPEPTPGETPTETPSVDPGGETPPGGGPSFAG